MDLLSAFKRKTPPAAATADAGDEVQRARARARQRLIGAAVLVVAGIIGFPLLFGTQPRPIPVDLPIEIPRKDAVPPLAMPGPASAPAPSVAASTPARPASAPLERVITETPADAGRELPTPPAAAPPPAAAAGPATAAKPASATPAPPARASAPSADAEAARAQALLEGKPAPAPASDAAAGAPRFVVQVGAFAEPAAAREARAKVEKLGLKTYVHVAETPAGPRTRVRVGPFATRDEAERAAAKLKSASMPAVILTL